MSALVSTKHKGHERHVALFEISSASVAAGVVRTDGHTSEVLWSKRFPYTVEHELDLVRYTRAMLSALLDAGMSLMSEGVPQALNDKSIHAAKLEAVCVLGAPWYVSGTQEDHVTGEKLTSVTTSFLDERKALGEHTFLESEPVQQFKEVMRSVQLMESVRYGVHLNGYPTDVYVGRKANDVDAAYWFAATSDELSTQILAVFDKVLPNAKTHLVSSTRLFHEVVRARLPQRARVILVEVSEEVTALSLVAQRRIVRRTTFPLGARQLIESVHSEGKNKKGTDGQMYLLASKNELTENLPGGLQASLREWQDAYREGVTEIVDGITPPRNVVLVSSTQWEKWYLRALEEPWAPPGVRTEIAATPVPLVPATEGDKGERPAQDRWVNIAAQGLSTVLHTD